MRISVAIFACIKMFALSESKQFAEEVVTRVDDFEATDRDPR